MFYELNMSHYNNNNHKQNNNDDKKNNYNNNNDDLPQPMEDFNKQEQLKKITNSQDKLQKKHTGNNKLKKSSPSQTLEEIQKTDEHLHNFLTRIVIKICELEASFRENKNEGEHSEFWQNLFEVDEDESETNKTLFTKVLNRNYNHLNIIDNNNILKLLDEKVCDIKGRPNTSSEIINQIIQNQNCKQLKRVLRLNNEDLNILKERKNTHQSSFLGKTLTDPMRTELNRGERINKATEIMLMLCDIQDVAFKIYNNKKSDEQEKQYAKKILLFFRQVLTTLYQIKIISVIDNRNVWKKVNSHTNEEENQQYWKQLLLDKQITKNKSWINFNLDENAEKIEKIDLTKLFWRNGKQYDGDDFHFVGEEMKNLQQCIDEQAKFKLDNSIILDKETKL